MTVKPEIGKQKEFPENLWTRCDGCGKVIYNKELDNQVSLPRVRLPLQSWIRLSVLHMLVDRCFLPFSPLVPQSLDFPGYEDKVIKAKRRLGWTMPPWWEKRPQTAKSAYWPFSIFFYGRQYGFSCRRTADQGF